MVLLERPARYERIFTVPNLLSVLRILLIPGIVLYYRGGDRLAAAALLCLSGISDVADGIIARKWDQVSDLGKILDPVADKLTQGALLCCLIPEHPSIFWLLLLLCAKETAMGIGGLLVLHRKEEVHSAQWFGKLSTMVLWAQILLLFLLPGLPESIARIFSLFSAGAMLLSFGKYMAFYFCLLGRNT